MQASVTLNLDQIISTLNSWMPQLDEKEQRVAVNVYQLLAQSAPVSVGELAKAVELARDDVRTILDRWPEVFRNDEDRIIGFWGLCLAETRHHLEVDGRTLYTWCAWDTLFIPEILQKTARVESTSPVTGEKIRLTVTPNGIEQLDPPGTVMSFVLPKSDKVKENVIGHFCHYVYLFGSAQAGSTWVSENEGTFLVSMEDAFALATKRNATRFNYVLV
jgi:alkylmercury lyase